MRTKFTDLAREIFLAALILLILIGSSLPSSAETIRFARSQIESIDRTNMTLTIKRPAHQEPVTLFITSRTRLFKNGEPATSSELEAGDAIHGSAHRSADGKIDGVRIYTRKAKN